MNTVNAINANTFNVNFADGGEIFATGTVTVDSHHTVVDLGECDLTVATSEEYEMTMAAEVARHLGRRLPVIGRWDADGISFVMNEVQV